METAIGIAIGLIIGVPLTLLGSYWLVRLQRERKEISYDVLTAEPIIDATFSEDDPIRVVVDGRFLGEKGVNNVQVSRVYSFKVSLRNEGNIAIEKGQVFIRLGEGSILVKVGVSLRGEKTLRAFKAVISLPCLVSIDIPFLNPKEELLAEMLSVNNQDSKCEVWAEVPNLRVYDRWARAQRAYNYRLRLSMVSKSIILGLFIFLDPRPTTAGPGTRLFVVAVAVLLILISFLLDWVGVPRRRGYVRSKG